MIPLLLLASVVAPGATFTCTPVAVWDGDGPIWCAEGPRIRLEGIAARIARHAGHAPDPRIFRRRVPHDACGPVLILLDLSA